MGKLMALKCPNGVIDKSYRTSRKLILVIIINGRIKLCGKRGVNLINTKIKWPLLELNFSIIEL
jgi:hypothetical protein